MGADDLGRDHVTPEEEIAAIAERLWKPAGVAAEFQTAESIIANHTAFVRACHTTWKDIHSRSIQRLLFFEGWLNREKTSPMGPEAKRFGEYGRAVWRRVNDAIVWTVMGMERHRVKRLCLYRAPSNLLECNPESAMATLADLNNDPLALALWNDATSCVDIGDVTLIRDGRRPHPEFIELKEGAVNEQIIKTLAAGPEARQAAEADLRERHGDKAMRQLERVKRQKAIANQALDLLQNEQGVDPVTGHTISVVESGVVPETYDAELRAQLDAAVAGGKGVLDCIDGCLWVYVATGGRREAPRTVRAFCEALDAKSTWYAAATSRSPPRDRDKLVGLNTSVGYPLAKPLYFRGLGPSHVAAITYGAFLDNVLMYLDWNGFADLIKQAGGELRWGSQKQAGRARAMHKNLRPSLVRGRLPIVAAHGVRAYVTDPNFVELFYDGARPRTLAERLVENCRDVAERAKADGRSPRRRQ